MGVDIALGGKICPHDHVTTAAAKGKF